MPSPIGHSLLGLTFAHIPLKQKLYHSFFWFVFVIFVANIADADFLVGWVLGDINRFHHGISHSIGMAVIFSLLCAIVARHYSDQAKQVFFVSLVVYISHLLADYFAVDVVEPFGAPFLWPFTDQYYASSMPLFRPVEHGNVGEHVTTVFDKIFSLQNAMAAMIEAAIVLPFWALTLWISRKG